ncbi:hypothetical protein KGF54_002951 [Candida jiufengensis]|uniref:uncharacterized protein n=1 Tax=Candida jiufengensis TaxID=497108 RepID=UPI002224BE15|nr:uncharacterized protein KGF54_002951 [Candida jiufengensis]KAI5953579.1 hypothetical protein KGF54_002951 [Candida jiufengensis]
MTIESVNTDPNITRIYIVRHGQTDHNVKKILQGHIDTSMNTTGLIQAEKLGEFFKNLPIDYFLSSDLIRCKQTLNEILKNQDYDESSIRYTSNLREREMGPVQNMLLKDALEKYGPNFRNFGEKEEQLCSRVETEFNKLLDSDYKNVIFCTHGGVITRFCNYLHSDLGFELNNGLTPNDLRVPFNTSITVVDYGKSAKKGVIQSFGGTDHLGGKFEVKDQLLR